MRLHILCPNCQQPARSHRKRQLSLLVTELSYNCVNANCGGAFVFVGEVHRWLRLPSRLDPQLNVPLSPNVHRRTLLTALAELPTADMPPEGEMAFPIPERKKRRSAAEMTAARALAAQAKADNAAFCADPAAALLSGPSASQAIEPPLAEGHWSHLYAGAPL